MRQEPVSLVDIQEGKEGTIVSVRGGRMAVKRLSDLGLTPQTHIKILRKIRYHGPVRVEVRNSSLVIGRGLAQKIMVQPK